MREMKDSGVEWIGKIPKDWNLERLQWHLEEIKDSNKTEKSKQVLSLTNSRGVIPYEEKGAQGNVAKDDYSQYKLAYPNTIVANSMNILIGSVGICNYFGCVSPVYYVFKPKDGENLNFINYLFQMEQFQKELRRFANGILEIRLRVSADGILKRKLAFPLLKEQEKIVACLEAKSKKVDALITNNEAQIEKLRQYKQSLITEVVTKGLDKTVSMKDSGVEWIGKIPEHWNVCKSKYCIEIQNGKKPILEGNIPVYGSGAASFTTCGEFKEGPSVLIGRKGATLHIPHYIRGRFWNIDTAFNVYANNNFHLKYYYYCATSFDYKYYISQTTLPSMTQTNYENIVLPMPEFTEQQNIVSYLNNKCTQIDKLISIKQAKIEKLNQYKKSLIYEYVTGKKEVK